MVGEDAGLFELLGERVGVVGIAGKAPRPHDQVAGGTDGDAGLDPELVGLTGLALADALNLLGMPGVELVLVLGTLVHQPFGLEQDRSQLLADLPGLALDVPDQSADDGALFPVHPTHALELTGMGVAAGSPGVRRALAGVALPTVDAVLIGCLDRLPAGGYRSDER